MKDQGQKEEEEVDINLEDPEVQGAALKIQAGFKGMKARQEVKALKVKTFFLDNIGENVTYHKQKLNMHYTICTLDHQM